MNKLARNYTENDCFFDLNDIGDWAGDETQALNQLNWIMKTVELCLNSLPKAPSPANFKNRVWKDWGGDTRILYVGEAEIAKYVLKLMSETISRREVAA